MKLNKITIKSESNFRTPMRADSLTGQILWYILYLKGQSFFDEFLNEFINNPQFVLSDAFNKDFIPKPIYFFKKSKIESIKNIDEYKEIKKSKKIKYIPIKKLIENDYKIDHDFLQQIVKKQNENKKEDIEDIITPHNTIDRILGTTYQEGGGFFETEEYAFNLNLDIYAYFKDEETKKLIKKCIKEIGECGYGADASIGKGVFQIKDDFKEIEINEKNANCFINLSTGAISTSDNLKKGYYKIFTRFGKLGGAFATLGRPFKKPILMFEPGSVFIKDDSESFKAFYGKAIKDVHTKSEIIHPAYILPLPVNIID